VLNDTRKADAEGAAPALIGQEGDAAVAGSSAKQ